MEVRCSLQLEDLYWLAGGDDPMVADAGDDPYAIPHARAEVTPTPRRPVDRLGRACSPGMRAAASTSGPGPSPAGSRCPSPAGLRRGMFVSVDLSWRRLPRPAAGGPPGRLPAQ